MSIEYLVDGSSYSLSYQDLREQYLLFCEKTDAEFMRDIAGAIHLAYVICFLKETPTYVCLCDKGIIHELAHCLHIGDKNTTPFQEIRDLFKQQLKLS